MQKSRKLELKRLYTKKIAPELRLLEKLFERVQQKIFLLILLVGLVFVSSFIPRELDHLRNFLQSLGIDPIYLIMIFFILCLGVGVSLYLDYTKYRREFKAKVIAQVIKVINCKFSYQAKEYIRREEFDRSVLFTQSKVNVYRGDDYVSGVINNVPFRFSEVNAKRTTGSGKSKRTHRIFHGLYIVIQSPKKFEKGHTVIYPDIAEKSLGKLVGKFLQKKRSLFSDLNLVSLEDPLFEREFAVYAHDQIESRYILTPDIMENLVRFLKRYKRALYLDFFEDQIHIAISTGAIFEPTFWGQAVSFKSITETYEIFELLQTIIKSMKIR